MYISERSSSHLKDPKSIPTRTPVGYDIPVSHPNFTIYSDSSTINNIKVSHGNFFTFSTTQNDVGMRNCMIKCNCKLIVKNELLCVSHTKYL